MKNRVGLVGCGTISKFYKKGLDESLTLSLNSVSDIKNDCSSRKIYEKFPFFNDYREMISKIPLDTIIISTPISNHFEIAEYALSHGVDVMVEKPMCCNMEEFYKLYEIAEKSGSKIDCLYHWRYAIEVIKFCDIIKNIGKIYEFKTVVCDPYTDDTGLRILPQKLGMGGTWMDSGINILSFLEMLFPLSDFKLKDCNEILDKSIPLYSRKIFDCNGIKIDITIDWRKKSNNKYSQIICEKGNIYMSHTNQFISLNGKQIFYAGPEARLESHYRNMFLNFIQSENSRNISEKILSALFKER